MSLFRQLVLTLLTLLWARGVCADEHVLPVPGDMSELQRATQGVRGLETFGQNGYWGLSCGYQPLLLGSRVPIAPAPHVPWAKPYARGPLKLLIITTFAASCADVEELAQVTRELDADVRWLLVADDTVISSASDERYRTVYLPEQAHALLREDYDAIVLTFGTNTPRHGNPRAHPYLPADVFQTILDKVSHGTGLVTVGQFSTGYWLDETLLAAAMPARMTPDFASIDAAHARFVPGRDGALFRGLDYHALRFPENTPLVVYDWKLQPDAKVLAEVAGKPVAMMRQHGQGRIVLLGWDGTLGPRRYAGRAVLEHGTALSLRAITYAARKEPPLQLELVAGRVRAGEASVIEARLSQPARVKLRVRDDTFRLLHELSLQARAGSNALPVPRLPNGEYFLEAIARDERGRALAWADRRLTVEAPARLTVQCDKASYQVGETVRVRPVLDEAEQNEQRALRFSVRDAAGRLLARQTRPYTPDVAFDYPIQDARVAPHKALIELLDEGVAVQRAAAQFFVPSSRWDDYENVLWPNSRVAPTNRLLRDEAGITALLEGAGSEEVSSVGAHFGQRSARINDGVLVPAQVQTAPLAAAAADPSLQASLSAAQRYGAVLWLLQDERHQMTDPGAPDTAGLARFRAYLRARYSSLSALNASWGARYASWDHVQPTLTEAVSVSGGVKNLAPWVDFRLYVADEAFQIDAARARSIRSAVGQDAVIGLDAFTTSAHALPYGALDFGRLTSEGVLSFYAPYDDDFVLASLLQGRPKAKYMGFTMSRADYFGLPWRDAFRGFWGSLRFFQPTFMSEFGYLLPAGRWSGEGTRELREGIGKLLIGSERELSPVVILYSYASLIANSGSKYWEPRHGGESLAWSAGESRSAIEQLLTAAGVSFGYQTDAQVASGALAGKKLLIVPRQMGVALSSATARAIEKFVRDGGTLLADLAPGVVDEHAKPRASGALDGLFGVQAAAEDMVHGPRNFLARVLRAHALLHEGVRLPDEFYDKRLRVTDGRAFGAHAADKAPAFIVKQTGKGRSLLLNTLLLPQPAAAALRSPELDPSLQLVWMRSVLEAAGVAPHARVESQAGALEAHVEINRFRDGANAYVGFYANAAPAAEADRVRARFDDAKETYDVRAGHYLGSVSEVPLALHAQEAALFARLDYSLRALELSLPPTAARGTLLQLGITLAATAEPGRHVVHVQVRGPHGALQPLYTQNVVIEHGRGQLQLMPALNDPPGVWQIEAREAVSGLTASGSFVLQ